MMTIYGILQCPILDEGSKSEGRRAILTDEQGNTYKLYRPEAYPVNDEYFYQFIGKPVIVTGDLERRTGNFKVESISIDESVQEPEAEAEEAVSEGTEIKTDTVVETTETEENN